MDDDPIELEPAGGRRLTKPDDRRRIPEPPPVTLVAVDDVHLPASQGLQGELDTFYVGLLGFWRDEDEHGHPIYRASNFRLHFLMHEAPVEHASVRPIGIEKPNLDDVRQWLLDEAIEYIVLDGIFPGDERLLIRDPAGNWLALSERLELA